LSFAGKGFINEEWNSRPGCLSGVSLLLLLMFAGETPGRTAETAVSPGSH